NPASDQIQAVQPLAGKGREADFSPFFVALRADAAFPCVFLCCSRDVKPENLDFPLRKRRRASGAGGIAGSGTKKHGMANVNKYSEEMAAIIQEAVNKLPGGFVIFGPDHEILLSNDQNERDFPFTNAALRAGANYLEAARQGVEALLPGVGYDESLKIANGIVSALERGEPVEVMTPNGTIMQVVETKLSGGGSVAVGADITALRERERELKKARKEAEAANEAKSAFLANISHEIRTPLNGILGMAQLMATSELTEEQRDQLETILDSGKTLMAILNDVLDLSKIEAGKFDISPIDNDLSHLLHRLENLWAPRAKDKGLWLSLSIDPMSETFLRFDPVRV